MTSSPARGLLVHGLQRGGAIATSPSHIASPKYPDFPTPSLHLRGAPSDGHLPHHKESFSQVALGCWEGSYYLPYIGVRYRVTRPVSMENAGVCRNRNGGITNQGYNDVDLSRDPLHFTYVFKAISFFCF